MATDALIVLDIGKTNAKLVLVDAEGRVLAERRRPNTIVDSGPYPHHDVEGIWDWMLSACREFGRLAQVSAIVPVTHGATAALVGDTGLVLPVLDYEAALPGVDYDAMRPPYSETYSPSLPAGLNLGRQLVWLEQRFPEQFVQTRHILMYPQYWAWRLCGKAAGEATSLGCHTDLWNPLTQRYSSLVATMGWEPLMPEVAPPSAVLGRLLPSVADASGLPADCVVVSGIHDSNASLMRYLRDDGARTVLSTGTWMIAAAFGAPLDGLREDADMLANSNALGKPVPCMRFMGGREFAALAGDQPETCTLQDIERLIAQGTLALPCFAEAGGPFAGTAGRIEGPAPTDARERYALATLYCVLMTDYCLDALQASGPLAVEGSFTANPWFGPMLSALRPQQPVTYSDDAAGTVCGGWMLRYRDAVPPAGAKDIAAIAPQALSEYRQRWLAALP
ncbi:FGGY-family carbohydrate kinase [Massilia terrae]|uniref:FGGY family carbohydrate kinase n=1 Tax=Massilia terrae TaxID=1811224 RepID=A0ABT2CTR4_9BURK|nr:FGGY family carbohydrate kinase [Massilia terrae]MCS0657229.1 FGGY family carbohydrate kinase [Massilia terrae]